MTLGVIVICLWISNSQKLNCAVQFQNCANWENACSVIFMCTYNMYVIAVDTLILIFFFCVINQRMYRWVRLWALNSSQNRTHLSLQCWSMVYTSTSRSKLQMRCTCIHVCTCVHSTVIVKIDDDTTSYYVLHRYEFILAMSACVLLCTWCMCACKHLLLWHKLFTSAIFTGFLLKCT